MERRYEFVERTLYLIRKLFEEQLPKEGTLDEMIKRRNQLLKKFIE